ncbi:type 1 glutamine amidotransferase domain-containing protein [Ancylobacter defluvii]|uniref:Dimethylallyltransferase n=1 Tax=Ancylobacter defluvii TaxID=1282440 RepID=A0A9W6JU34_9HYPH|nr:type 1 glutamine amidotransferase domain-containing protein [Ancylobacter defluvii]MBS7586109.1 type 1 glutamine amidotransferase domain-containing protein [Ancylobacter defluvii]GLK82304.1 dimethylallyltransferase [Ancylobacter defluvii]
MNAHLKILMILTSSATMGEAGEPTGLWFEELATPYYAFVDADALVALASIRGGPAPIDSRSVKARGENEANVDRFLVDEAASKALNETLPVRAIDISEYDAVFLPGGHGTMWDLPESAELALLLGKAWADGKVIAAVCHGPAGLVNVKDEDGIPLVSDRRVTCFSDSEERAAGLDEAVPFLLETRLRALGGRYESIADFQSFAIADGRLVTGQNPASSALTARLTLEALNSGDAR